MKVAVLILVILGLLAAGAAAVLVETLKFNPMANREVPVVEILVAQQDLTSRTRLEAKHVEVQKAPSTGLPVGYFSNPAQAIGKVLKLNVAKGEILTMSLCVAKGSIDDLLRPGMLAFPAQFSRRFTAFELLYPGCIVDVFATFPLRDRARGDSVVTPLLQNIQVLAVGIDTVIPQEEEKAGIAAPNKRSAGGYVPVTLEVNARQAAALQLAMEQGTLGLAMRSQTDKSLNPMEPMVVKEGQLVAGSEALDPQMLALVGRIQQMLGQKPIVDPNAPVLQPKALVDPNLKPAVATAPVPMPTFASGIQEEPKKASTMQVTVIRGANVKQEDVPLGEEVGQGEPNAVKTKEGGV
jgi:Flp pilus assembly protein CpaB